MTQEQFLFLLAINAFKEANGRTFPTWTDVLEVVRELGYRKTMKSELQLGNSSTDWTEEPDAKSGVQGIPMLHAVLYSKYSVLS